MKKKKKPEKRKEKKESVTLKEKVSKLLEIPDEVATDRPKFTDNGKKKSLLRIIKELFEFTNEIVRI